MYDIVIKNGIVFDGTGSGGIRVDIGIKDGAIEDIEESISEPAGETVNAEGLYVSPGFIDIQNHSDSHGLILTAPSLSSMTAQGVTTVVVGQCGASLAPLGNPDSIRSFQKWGAMEGVNIDWRTFGQFAAKLSGRKFGANIVTLIGHATVRRSFVGDTTRQLNENEFKSLGSVISKSIDEGAFGCSFGLQYAHEINTTAEEIKYILEIVKEKDAIFSIHLVNQDVKFLESVRQALEWADELKVKTKIAHFKIEGPENYGQLKPAMDSVEHAYQSGTNVRFDLYPYATSWHPLYTYLPRWAYEGGVKPMIERLKDKNNRKRVLQELSAKRAKIAGLMISSSPKVVQFVGRTFHQLADTEKITPEEAVLRVLTSNNGQAVVFEHDIIGEYLTGLLKHPLSFVASDGVGYDFKKSNAYELPHPRCFGTFPRFLRLLRDDEQEQGDIPLMKWGEGIAKITGQAAEFLGLSNRGFIKRTMAADLVIFDPRTVSDTADYHNPYRHPIGIKYVIVNGKISLYDEELTNINGGQFIKSNG